MTVVELGRLAMTPGIVDRVLGGFDVHAPLDEVMAEGLQSLMGAILRHQSGDWGTVDQEDAAANDRALLGDPGRLLSQYTVDGVTVWIITEADRSLTTILLPDEY